MADEMYSNIRDFYFPVLHIIRDMAGQARANEVCDRFLSRHRHQLDSSFFTEIKDGDVKWHDWVHRAHYQLKQMGYLRDPQRGIWALTDKPWPTNKAGFERVGSGARAVRSAAPKSAAADRPSSRIAAPVRSAARTETAGPTDDQPVHQVRYSTIAKESTSRFVPVSASEPLAAGSTRREPNVDEGAARHVGEPRQSPSVRETKHVTRSGSSDRDLRVQSAITSVSFPDSVEGLRAMGQKWLGLVGQDWITDMDVLSDFPVGATVPWIAPKWLTEGDILFFYHTKSAANLIRSLRKHARTATLT